jgi:hypothetical protein
MNTTAEMRDLTPDELEEVSGGTDSVTGTFKYGNLIVAISATADHRVVNTSGDGGKTWSTTVDGKPA